MSAIRWSVPRQSGCPSSSTVMRSHSSVGLERSSSSSVFYFTTRLVTMSSSCICWQLHSGHWTVKQFDIMSDGVIILEYLTICGWYVGTSSLSCRSWFNHLIFYLFSVHYLFLFNWFFFWSNSWLNQVLKMVLQGHPSPILKQTFCYRLNILALLFYLSIIVTKTLKTKRKRIS